MLFAITAQNFAAYCTFTVFKLPLLSTTSFHLEPSGEIKTKPATESGTVVPDKINCPPASAPLLTYKLPLEVKVTPSEG